MDATNSSRTKRFEATVLPHLDAAYNLARWLLQDSHSAHDAVQEAYLRAFRFFDKFNGENARPWLMRIVRNTCYDALTQQAGSPVSFDEQLDSDDMADGLVAPGDDPLLHLERKLDRAQINAAIARLPPLFREVLILREIEEMSYEEIATTVDIPVGTVMSRLSRARCLLRSSLLAIAK